MNTNNLHIVICSYGRYELLKSCLDSLKNQDPSHQSYFSVLVVNNFNNDTARIRIGEIMEDFPDWSWVDENETGLSIARNRGISETSAPWIAFLDDDAIVLDNYIATAINTIRNDDFDCFGGPIESYWPFGRPKWLSAQYGSKPWLSDETCRIDDHYVWGSNMIFRRKALEEAGGFPSAIGLKGDRIGYAAENLVQDAIRKSGGTVGYVPHLVAHHAVLPHKFRIYWHLRASYAEGRDGKHIFPENYTISGLLSLIKKGCSMPLKGLFLLTDKEKYYRENFILDSLQPWFLFAGRVRAILK